MRQLAILILFNILCIAGSSQIRKLPVLGMPNQVARDTELLNAGITKVKIVAFVPRKQNKLDTDYVFNMEYYPTGYLKQTENYGYDSELHTADPDFLRLAGKLYDRQIDCSRITYSYDTHYNLVTKMSYEVIPAGSYEAFMEDVGNIANKLEDERKESDKKEVTPDDVRKIAASLKKAGIPEIEKEGKMSRFKYDADDNMIYYIEGFDERHYTYEHDSNGRVKVIREVFNRNGPGSDKLAAETWLTYTADGFTASVTNYFGHGDSGNIAVDSKMMKKEELSYNKFGQPVRILTANSGKPYHKAEVITYKDSLKISDAVYEVNREKHRNDTITYTTFSYRKGFRGSARHKYYDGRVMRIEREEVYLDLNGLQTKTVQYAKAGSKPEQLTGLQLYFYSK